MTLPKETLFSAEEWLRYTRHIQLPQFGVAGQKKLKRSQVLIVGAGGLGSPVALYLAAAGVGHIILVDSDTVDTTNLQRQILFSSHQVGNNKAESGKQRLLDLNPDITVTAISEPLNADNADQLISSADLVIDCTDNFSARYLINDSCVRLAKTWIFAAIHQYAGQCALFAPGDSCFRCLFPEMPQTVEDCNSTGVLGVLPGMLGIFQANEAIKFLAGQPLSLKSTLLMIDAQDLNFRKIGITKDKQCTTCGTGKGHVKAPQQPVCVADGQRESMMSPDEFELLRQQDNCLVIDVRDHAEREAFHIGGVHIPLSELADQLQQIDDGKTVLCYCQSGKRSAAATRLLEEHGFNSRSLDGGLANWLKQRSGQ